MNPVNNKIENYYDSLVAIEWERLEWHKMEFAIIWRSIQDFILPGSTILDIGGGPGRYSIHLAQAGHQVTLLDLSNANINFARYKAQELGVSLADYVHGNALDLSRFDNASFDTVLLMGPLYHLLNEQDRIQATKEAFRVLKPGGLILATFISRYAFLIYLLKDNPAEVVKYRSIIDQLLTNGVNMESENNPGFTDAYFIHPFEITPFMAARGFIQIRLSAVESFVSFTELTVNMLPNEAFRHWVDITYQLGTDPAIWGNSEHMLYIGKKSSETTSQPSVL